MQCYFSVACGITVAVKTPESRVLLGTEDVSCILLLQQSMEGLASIGAHAKFCLLLYSLPGTHDPAFHVVTRAGANWLIQDTHDL